MEFVIAEEKLIYLLRTAGKTKFFLQLGYREGDLPRLEADILQMARRASPVIRAVTAFGTKFEMTGMIAAPNGRDYFLRTGWFIRPSEPEVMNFVTAYPAKLR